MEKARRGLAAITQTVTSACANRIRRQEKTFVFQRLSRGCSIPLGSTIPLDRAMDVIRLSNGRAAPPIIPKISGFARLALDQALRLDSQQWVVEVIRRAPMQPRIGLGEPLHRALEIGLGQREGQPHEALERAVDREARSGCDT